MEIVPSQRLQSIGSYAFDEVDKKVAELKDKGIAVIFITHNLYHVYSVADRIVVIAHGQELTNMKTKDTSVDQISKIIVRGTLGEEV